MHGLDFLVLGDEGAQSHGLDPDCGQVGSDCFDECQLQESA